jgi:hypothetical protein
VTCLSQPDSELVRVLTCANVVTMVLNTPLVGDSVSFILRVGW